MPTLSIAQASAIIHFLTTAQISGAEAPILIDCVNALNRIIEAAQPPTDKE